MGAHSPAAEGEPDNDRDRGGPKMDAMTTLTITRGLPGAGKTTWARATGLPRVNRDDLRRMLHGGPVGTGQAEKRVTIVQRAMIEALLRAGVSVVCDDTNLRRQVVRDLAALAAACGADFAVQDFTDVPVEECIRRDAARTEGEHVGEAAIRRMYDRHLARRPRPLPVPGPVPVASAPAASAPYEPPAGAPDAVLVDIDGTVALMTGRSPYDYRRVAEDAPNEPVVAAVRAMSAAGYRVVYCTGREDSCRVATEAWLAEHVGVPYDALHMRRTGDRRRDALVKREIFDAEVRHRYRVVCVFDDRRQVVAMWRDLGLTVMHVAEGDF